MSAASSISAASTAATDPATLLRQQMQAARKTAMDAAAKSLSMSSSDLQQQLQSGKSLKDVAAAKGVDFSKVQSAITTAVTPQLTSAVQSGDMTSQQAQSELTKLTSGEASKVHKGHHHHGGPPPPPPTNSSTSTSAADAALAMLTTPSYSASGTTSQSSTPGTILNQTA